MWTAISLASVAVIVSVIAAFSFFRGRRPAPTSQTTIQSTVERIREIGELCVLEVNFKEIVTHKKKGGLLTTDGKMLMVCHFSIEFRYDLRQVQIENGENGNCVVVMPPYFPKVNTGDIKLYHEEKAAFLGMIPIDFSVDERNQIVDEARAAAVQQALASLPNIEQKIRISAASTLNAIINGCGIARSELKFLNPDLAQKQINDGIQKSLPPVSPG